MIQPAIPCCCSSRAGLGERQGAEGRVHRRPGGLRGAARSPARPCPRPQGGPRAISILAWPSSSWPISGPAGRQLQIAAEYLVMAAARLPQVAAPAAAGRARGARRRGHGRGPGERLRRLEALRRAAAALPRRPRLGEAALRPRRARKLPDRAHGATGARAWRAVRGLWGADAARPDRRMTMPARRLITLEAACSGWHAALTGQDWRGSLLPA